MAPRLVPVEYDPFAGAPAGFTAMSGPEDRGEALPEVPKWAKALVKYSNAVAAALGAPRKALQGGYNTVEIGPDGRPDAFPAGMKDDAGNLAGMAMTGGFALPKAPGSLGIFGGQLAKTADLAALEKAQTMAAIGHSKGEIFDATGWFTGVDGKWRFEIPDTKAKLDMGKVRDEYKEHIDWTSKKKQILRDKVEEAGYPRDTPYNKLPPELWDKIHEEASDLVGEYPGKVFSHLKDVLEHPALFDAYPDLAKVKVKKETDPGYLGTYSEVGGGELSLSPVETHAGQNYKYDPLGTTLHEVQHAIQQREGFARGGNPQDPDVLDMAKARYKETTADYNALVKEYQDSGLSYKDWSNKNLDKFAKINRFYGYLKEFEKSLGETGYKNLAGETEARNVTKRWEQEGVEKGLADAFGVSPAKKRYPWETQDVPDWKQLIRKSIGK